jgi:hypothetical protein
MPTDKYDEANSRASQFCESARKRRNLLKIYSTFICNKYAFTNNNAPKFSVLTYLNLISAIHAAFPVKL